MSERTFFRATGIAFSAALALSAGFAGNAAAQQRLAQTPLAQAQPAWYVGVGGGTSSIKDPGGNFATVGGGGASELKADTTHPMIRAFGGFRFSPNWSVEAGYGSYGTFGGQRTYATPAGTIGADVKVSGFNVHMVGWLPMTSSFAGFAKVGLVASTVKTEASTTITGVSAPNVTRREVNLAYGLGFQYDFNRNWALRAEWEQIKNVGNKNDYGLETNVSVTSGSAIYKF